jgi:hypothetical protein
VTAGECPAEIASGMAATFDWSKDFSLTYGSEFAKNWSRSLQMFKAAQAIKPKAPKDATRAAAVVLDRASALQEAAKTSPAANFQAMGFPRGGTSAAGGHGSKGPMGSAGYKGRNNNCGCENSCGWGDLNTYNYVSGRMRGVGAQAVGPWEWRFGRPLGPAGWGGGRPAVTGARARRQRAAPAIRRGTLRSSAHLCAAPPLSALPPAPGLLL